jgi:hypothetical protein
MKKLILLGAFLLLIPSKAGQYKMDVLCDGQPLRQFAHNGKAFVQGVTESPFVIHFENNSGGRVLVVPSVDGLSALDGSKATPESGGYVVPAHDKLDLKGWRISLEQVKQFVFATKASGETYADKVTGDTANCGVISLRVIPEKPTPPPSPFVGNPIWIPLTTTNGRLILDASGTSVLYNASGTVVSTCNALCSTAEGVSSVQVSNTSSFDLGTKMGATAQSIVHEISFERDSTSEDLTVYYASLNGLRDLGVDMRIYPEAFGYNETVSKFCKVH